MGLKYQATLGFEFEEPGAKQLEQIIDRSPHPREVNLRSREVLQKSALALPLPRPLTLTSLGDELQFPASAENICLCNSVLFTHQRYRVCRAGLLDSILSVAHSPPRFALAQIRIFWGF